MAINTEHNASLAVLIDGDNTTPSIIEALLAEIAKYGSASVKRAYGDWTTPNLRGWKEAINAHAIQPMQQFAYTTGKNATDSALIIDAMDLMYSGHLDGFCIVSSDSDFTRLASRIRESGKSVYGFGEKKTPQPFVAACDRFIYTEIFVAATEDEASRQKMSPNKLRQDAKLINLFRSAIESLIGEGAQIVVLGCTEVPAGLPMADPWVRDRTIDPTEALARAAYNWAMGERAKAAL